MEPHHDGKRLLFEDHREMNLYFKPNGISIESYLEQLIKDKIIERIEQ